MKFIKKNYGWIIVVLLASLPLITLIRIGLSGTEEHINMLYHISGEFAIRWMTAVLTCTPFFILFGITNLFVRQAMGIATAVWSLIHFTLFIWVEGLMETFTQINYVAGFIAVLILVPLFLTSNRKSMRKLKLKWKKLQSFSYVAISLSLVHIVLLEKTWLIYAIIVGLGFIIRIPAVKGSIITFKLNRKNSK